MGNNGVQIAAVLFAFIGTIVAYFATVVSRFFCILAITAGLIALFVFLGGMDCATLNKNPAAKKKMRLAAGIMIFIGGALLFISGIFMGVYIVRHYQDTYMPQLNYNNYNGNNNGGYSSAGFFGRKRRDESGVADNVEEEVVDGVYDNKLDAFLEACSMGYKCDCGEDQACQNALAKGTRKWSSRGQAMVFGMGTFLAIIGGVLQMLSGGLMISQGCGASDEEEYDNSEYGTYNQGQAIVNPNKQSSNYL